MLGSLLGMGAVFIAFRTHADQRGNTLLRTKGVQGDGEIVRRFVASNGVAKRLEYRIAGAAVKNIGRSRVRLLGSAGTREVRSRAVRS